MIDEEKADAALTLLEDIAFSLVTSEDDEVIESEIEEVAAERSYAPGASGGSFSRPSTGGPNVVLRLYIAPSEMTQIIGRQGRTAHSLRVILNALSVRHGQRYTLDIVEQQPENQPPIDDDNA